MVQTLRLFGSVVVTIVTLQQNENKTKKQIKQSTNTFQSQSLLYKHWTETDSKPRAAAIEQKHRQPSTVNRAVFCQHGGGSLRQIGITNCVASISFTKPAAGKPIFFLRGALSPRSTLNLQEFLGGKENSLHFADKKIHFPCSLNQRVVPLTAGGIARAAKSKPFYNWAE